MTTVVVVYYSDDDELLGNLYIGLVDIAYLVTLWAYSAKLYIQ